MKVEIVHSKSLFSVFCILIILFFAGHAYTQTTSFVKQIQKTGLLIQTIQTSDRGYTLLSLANSSTNRYNITHITASGEKAWDRILSVKIDGTVNLTSIIQAADGNYFVIGTRYYDEYQGTFSTDGIVVRLDSTGAVLWTKSYANGPIIWSVIRYYSSIATPDGGAIITGEVNSGFISAGGNQASFFTLSADGDVIPATNFGFLRYRLNQQMKWNNEGFLLTGGAKPYGGAETKDVFRIVHMDDSLNVVWTQSLSSPGIVFQRIVVKRDDGIIVVGSGTIGSGGRCKDCNLLSLVELNSSGSVKNKVKFRLQGPLVRSITDMQETSDSGFVITGITGDDRFFLLKLDSSLNFVFQQTYSDPDVSGGFVFQSANAGYFLFRSSGVNLIYSLVNPNGAIRNCDTFSESTAARMAFGKLESAEFDDDVPVWHGANGSAEGVAISGVSSSPQKPVTTICQ